MPELPDITIYLEALEKRTLGHVLQRVRVAGPFLLRTATPPIDSVQGRKVAQLRRIGKRIAFGFDNDLWLVFHLMIAGRLHWKAKPVNPDGRRTLATFEFDSGTLTLTEAGAKKRASLHLLIGEDGLRSVDPGGLEVLTATSEQFAAALTSENHTLKRSLTDPRLFSGIGNAYSDEILYHAQLSPVQLTQRMQPEAIERLLSRNTCGAHRLDRKIKEGNRRKIPGKGDRVPRGDVRSRPLWPALPQVRHQNSAHSLRVKRNELLSKLPDGGKLLADRALSRLLREDWPRSLDEMDQRVESKRKSLTENL